MVRGLLTTLAAAALISASTAFAADVVDARDASGSTPLLVAASIDDVEQVKQLLKTGANPNVRNKLDTTPLLEAADFHGIRLHNGGAKRHLTVAADGHFAAVADRENGRGVEFVHAAIVTGELALL